jgi:hypothetical protein
MWQPSMTLKMYQTFLFQVNETTVHESVISRWFLARYSFKGNLRKLNVMRVNMIRAGNVQRAYDCIDSIRQTNLFRLQFGIKKHLECAELFTRTRYGRQDDPITGEVPVVITDCNLRNTHCITSLCGINSRTVPVFYNITDQINDFQALTFFIEEAVANGFMQRWDVLVLDNASMHVAGENADLDAWLWNGLSGSHFSSKKLSQTAICSAGMSLSLTTLQCK